MEQMGEGKEEMPGGAGGNVYIRGDRDKHGGEIKCIYTSMKKTSLFY